jgi:hypothetical protein
VFVDGAFWHGHPDYYHGQSGPFWDEKIARNRERDNPHMGLRGRETAGCVCRTCPGSPHRGCTWSNRLGNHCLLKKTHNNNKIGNKPWSAKKPILLASSLRLTKIAGRKAERRTVRGDHQRPSAPPTACQPPIVYAEPGHPWLGLGILIVGQFGFVVGQVVRGIGDEAYLAARYHMRRVFKTPPDWKP